MCGSRRNDLVTVDGVVRAVPTDDASTIDTGLVLRSIGYRGAAVAGVPFDDAAGVIPNAGGRVDADSADIRRGLDQARTDGIHRHQQDLCPGDGRATCWPTSTPGCSRNQRAPSTRSPLSYGHECRSTSTCTAGGRSTALSDVDGARQGRSRRKLTDVAELLEVADGHQPRRHGAIWPGVTAHLVDLSAGRARAGPE